MVGITEILDMLDWHMSPEIQSKGISLGKKLESIVPFIQPQTLEHNKNVWDNCAKIIAYKADKDLQPHLIELLEWLQDMNWPGSFCILDRLKKYSNDNLIHDAINACIKKAKCYNDEIWANNLLLLKQSRNHQSKDDSSQSAQSGDHNQGTVL